MFLLDSHVCYVPLLAFITKIFFLVIFFKCYRRVESLLRSYFYIFSSIHQLKNTLLPL